MSTVTANHKRIVKNTLMLYFRMLLTTGVSLYTVRVVLNVLGIEDYGIYAVVGGLVSLFAFLPGTMASATQRFFSFALGQNNLEQLKKTFTVNWVLYAVIALGALLLLETVGVWFVDEHLRIPPDRVDAARILYQLSVFAFILGIFTSPFRAIIIAHEDMHIYAYMSIAEVLLKLGTVFLLIYLPGDKLEIYGQLLLVIAFVNTVVYIMICIRKYEECQFLEFHWDKKLLRETMGFTGWTLFGQVSTVARNQAVTILLNQSFNPVVVAARAIAINVSSQINTFSSSFNVSLYPPIIKAYAAGNKDEMFSFIFNGCKITFFLMWIFALPLFLEMHAVLTLWLKEPPPAAVLFTQLSLVEALIMSVSLPLTTAARAPGKMRLYESVLGCIQIAIFLISWLVLTMGAPPYSVFIVAIIANVVMFFFRLVIVRKLIAISVEKFFLRVILPIFGVVLLSLLPSLALASSMPSGLVFSAISIVTSAGFAFFCIYFIGLDKFWREKLRNMITSRIYKFLGLQ